jgi:hypothetical protein
MENSVLWILILFSITPAISFLDWTVFGKSKKDAKWHDWIPATALEILMFAFGMLVGQNLM